MAGPPTVTKEELARKLGRPGVVVVNVLAPIAYERIRIRGSISIPRHELVGGRWAELDRSSEVVVYCSSYDCEASRACAEFLAAKGFDVKAYEGGIREWAEAGLPTDGLQTAAQFLEERYSAH